jgi:hypothetical protein
MKSFRVKFLVILLYAFGNQLIAQTPSAAAPAAPNAAADRSMGEVASVDGQRRVIILKEDKGEFLAVVLGDKTSLLRIPPGETDLKKATRITIADIGAGDRLLAVGPKAETGKSVNARTIVVISKSDLAQKQQKDQEEWQKRGISGTVASLDPSEKGFIVTVGEKKYRVQTSDKTEFRRYAADSAKFSDSQSSSLANLRTGDQIRVLGDKSEEGLTLKAERVVAGSFTRVAGTISSIRAEAKEIKLTELISGKAYTVQLTARSNSRMLPLAVANLIAQRLLPSSQGGPVQAGAAPGAGAGIAALRAGGGDLSQLLDRLPAVSLSDLKPGNAIVVSGSPGVDATKITAITLLSGIEPIANAVPNLLRDIIGGWNLGGGGGDLLELPQ